MKAGEIKFVRKKEGAWNVLLSAAVAHRCASLTALIRRSAHYMRAAMLVAALSLIETEAQGATITVHPEDSHLDLSYDAVDWILGAPPLAIRWLKSLR
jgi:hypothetical protein